MTPEKAPKLKRKHRFYVKLSAAALAGACVWLLGWPTTPGPFAYSIRYFIPPAALLAVAVLSFRRVWALNVDGTKAYLAKRRYVLLPLAGIWAGLLLSEGYIRAAGLAEWGAGQGPLQPSYRLARYRLNSMRFRGPEWPTPAEASQRSTVVLGIGDSFAIGQGVEWGDTYLQRLERKLNESRGASKPVATLNAALPGWDTPQEYEFFSQAAAAYHPAALILQYTLNDAESQPYFLRPLTDWAWEPPVLWRSHLFFYLVRFYNFKTRPYEAFIREAYADGSPGWSYGRTALKRMRLICAQRHMLPVLLIFPLFQDLRDYRFADIHQKVAQAGREAGFEVVDLLDDFRRYSGPVESLRVSGGDWHPSAIGHQIAADALFRRLAELRWMGNP